MKDREASHNRSRTFITPLEHNRQQYVDMGLTPPSAVSLESLKGVRKTTHQPGIPMTEYRRGPIAIGCFSQTKQGNSCKAHPVKGTHKCVGHTKQGD